MGEGYNVLDRSGYTSTVYYLPDHPPRVCKSFNADRAETLSPVEREAYERFSAHNTPTSILRYYGVHDTLRAGIVLELAEKGSLHNYRWEQKHIHNADPDIELIYRWARQATEALAFAHSLGVYNSDIHCINFFLDKDLNLKVGDWAGASIDGSRSQSSYRLRHRLIDASGTDVARATGISAVTEVFALGTALYFIVTCQDPWPELRQPEDDEEIRKRIREKDFPDTSALPVLGDVISKCWNVDYASMAEVQNAIEADRAIRCPSESASSSHNHC